MRETSASTGTKRTAVMDVLLPQASLSRSLRALALKGKAHPRAASGARLGPDLTALGFDQPTRNGQPEAGAPIARGPRDVAAPEALEHSPFHLRPEAFPGVLDGHLEASWMGFDEHRDRAVGGCVSKRVRDQVEEHALNLIGRAPRDPIAAPSALALYPPRPGFRLQPAQARVNEPGEFGVAQLERQRARIDAGEFEQIVARPRERPPR